MQYDSLNTSATYERAQIFSLALILFNNWFVFAVRVVYAGDAMSQPIKLVANGNTLIHDFMPKPNPGASFWSFHIFH